MKMPVYNWVWPAYLKECTYKLTVSRTMNSNEVIYPPSIVFNGDAANHSLHVWQPEKISKLMISDSTQETCVFTAKKLKKYRYKA